MQHRFAYLDILRLLAVVLVMFGHYVLVGGGATAIPGIINEDFVLPLVDQSKWNMWKFEILMIEKFSTQAAILGVTLFFIVTGYLMPMMLERYTRLNFLVNRFFRIFPVLFVAMIVIGLFVGVTQKITFNLTSYIASWTLTYQMFGVVPVAGILWTLMVEVLFYACAAMMGKFSVLKLFLLQSILLTIILASTKSTSMYYLMLAAIQAKYILMICVGSAIYLTESEEKKQNKFIIVFGSVVLSYIGFQMYRVGHDDSSTYNNLGTHLLALALFYFFYWLARFNLLKKLPRALYWLAELVYPIYLIHAAIGLGMMAMMRSVTTEPYIQLIVAISSSVFLSWLLHNYIEGPGISFGRSVARRLQLKGVV
jgi:peptidoglycan/LPS O-acetylase OafA/YrhL